MAAKLCRFAICTVLLLESLHIVSANTASLSPTYYQEKCPGAEGIIHNKVRAWIKKDPTLAAALIRLHFHDCAVRGCDGSILLNHRGSERTSSRASRTLRGFQVIDDIKSSLESACPRTVSCADILTATSRDATVALGGPFWTVDFGRKDGRISLSREADAVPQGHENVTALIDFFRARGLTVLDLVVLSGSHTIGRSACSAVMDRIDAGYFRNLTRTCRFPGHMKGRFVNLDVTTPFKFDAEYYVNLGKRLGLLKTDQLLYSDRRTAPFVSTLATQAGLFESQFAVSMVKLGNVVDVKMKKGGGGEIRWNCNYVNPSGRRQ
ncbi:Peroxidase 7 [Linum grandiflorum]